MSVQVRLEKDVFTVGESCEVRIAASSSQTLEVGDTIEFQFPNSWSLISGPSFTRGFQSEACEKSHFIKVFSGVQGVEFEVNIKRRGYPFTKGAARHGRLITGRLIKGTVPAGCDINFVYANTFAPDVAEVDEVWISLKGEEPETKPKLRVLPLEAERLRVIVPSGVQPGQKFDVLIVSLDKNDNCSKTKFSGEKLYMLPGELVAEGLNFEGCVRVPVSILKEGIYRFKIRDSVSNAVRIKEGVSGPYWGDTHIHSKLSCDAEGSDPYTYARDVSGLDFAAVADHYNSIGNVGYDMLIKWAEDANEKGRFVTIPADERNPKVMTGHHNIYFRNIELFRNFAALEESEYLKNPGSIMEGIKACCRKEVMLIPHHTGICFGNLEQETDTAAVNIDAHEDYGLRPVMEIYSHHGQSEVYCPQHILAYEYNRMRRPERRANVSTPGPHYAQDYWIKGRRMGVIASSDEHSGQGGRTRGGIAAVWADELGREAVFDALADRKCYATTGERILLDFFVDGHSMGSEINRVKGNRLNLKVSVWGTDKLLKVELLRYREGIDLRFESILSFYPGKNAWDADYGLEDVVETNTIYYARITQEPIGWVSMAWSSPVWVNVE